MPDLTLRRERNQTRQGGVQTEDFSPKTLYGGPQLKLFSAAEFLFRSNVGLHLSRAELVRSSGPPAGRARVVALHSQEASPALSLALQVLSNIG